MTTTATAAPYTNGTIQDISVDGLLHAGGYGTSQQPTTPQPQAQPPQSQPSALLSAATVLLSTLAGTSDHYEHVTLQDTIRSLYSRIKDDAEKQKFETLVYGAFKKGQDAIDFIASCQTSSGGNPFDDALTMDELIERPDKEWLVEKIIGKGDMGMIYGASGSGKTFVVIDLIGAMVSGEQFANRFSMMRPLNVGYCAGEGVSGLPARFKAMINKRNLGKIENFYFWQQAPQLYVDKKSGRPDGNIAQFVSAYKKAQDNGNRLPLDVLFIDTLHSATAGADENSAGDTGTVMESCKAAVRELGCAVILVHHTGKSGDSERGSSAMRGALDTMICIKKNGENNTKAVMHNTKLKDAGEWKPQGFDLVANGDSVAVWWDDPADEVTTKGAQAIDKERIIKELAKFNGKWFEVKHLAAVIGKSDSHTRNLLAKLVDDNQIVRRLKNESIDPSSSNPWVFGEISMMNTSSHTNHKPIKN